MFKKSLKNLIILLIAPGLALVLFYATRDLSALSASVLDIMEIEKIQKSWRGLAYKITNQNFEVFWSELAKTMDTVHFVLLYNPDKITFSEGLSWMNSQLVEDWVLSFELKEVWSHSLEKDWFQLSFSGDAKDLIMWEARGIKKGKEIPLAVGNLNILQEHATLP